MATVLWPDLDELKQTLDVESTDWDGEDAYLDGHLTRLSRVLAAAIARVKLDVGQWDEYVDEPDEALAQAALRMAVLMAPSPEVPPAIFAKDNKYQALLYGHRRRFGIA